MNNISVVLKITDFKIEPDTISKMLDLSPTAIHIAGEEYNPGPANGKPKKLYTHNYWEYRVTIKNNSAGIKTIIDQFIREVIAGKSEALEKIKNDCRMEFYIGVKFNGRDGLDSFYFDTSLLKLFSDLGIGIAIDQYLLPK